MRVIFCLLFYLFFINIVTGQQATISTGSGIDYKHTIHPLLNKNGCNTVSCHGNKQNNVHFSMFAASARADYETLTRQQGGRYVHLFAPDRSLLLRTLTGRNPSCPQHFQPEVSFINKIRSWINLGAPYQVNDSSSFLRLELSLQTPLPDKGATSKIVAKAVFGNGTKEVITPYCYFESQNSDFIGIDQTQVTTLNYGEGYLLARYMHHFAILKISVPQPGSREIPQGKTAIDQLVNKKLKALGLPPSPICSDETFVRRVYLDVTGRIPTATDTEGFLTNQSSQKRHQLIQQLIHSEGYAEFQTLKWGDLLRCKSEFPSNLWPNAVQAYHKWLKDCFVNNKPYDQFVKELLLSSGSNFRSPTVNFYRAFQNRTPQKIAETSGLLFTGTRYECAGCHAHPKTAISEQQASAMGQFFSQVKYKKTAEWKEEIVYIDKGINQPGAIEMPDGDTLYLTANEDYRIAYANWLTSKDNPLFAKVIVNRIWFWLMGHGIVHAPDDFRSTNPPSNPPLLNYLASELTNSNFDLKHIFSLILESDTYQRAAATNEWNHFDNTFFSHRQLRRLEAEQLIDAICDITGIPEKYMSKVPEPFTFLPENYRAVQLADGTISTPFLEMFGRPSRDISNENDRDHRLNRKQILHLLNSSHMLDKIRQSQKIEELIRTTSSSTEIINQLYLTILNRYPEKAEQVIAQSHLSQKADRKRDAIDNLIWALINSSEFVFNH